MSAATAIRVSRAHGAGFTYKTMTAAVGYKDREAIPDAVAAAMKYGKPFTPELEKRIQRVLDDLQSAKEVMLNSYSMTVIAGLEEIRAALNAGKARLIVEAEQPGFTIRGARRIFVTETMKIVGRGADGIERSLEKVKGKPNIGRDYLSASTLMTLAEFWVDLMDAIRPLGAVEDFDPVDDLDFSHLELGPETIHEVLAASFKLYDRVWRNLRPIANLCEQASKKAKILTDGAGEANAAVVDVPAGAGDEEVARARLARSLADDAESDAMDARSFAAKSLAARDDGSIAALNKLGLQSLAMEVELAVARYESTARLPVGAAPFGGIDKRELNQAVKLIDGPYGDHMLICRNLVYMAVQLEDFALADRLTRHMATVLKETPERIWEMRIWGRTPLTSEPTLANYRPHFDGE
jgi:hypothetical protein